ncbi:hypothetical protein ACFIJ5_07745 [Haloimpatiens sp. FM7330]|uniref:hypothetical protein n=1 Tax=Haloimpatiens sp. FM7330 TaxID=3298610 RepID=UPI0036338EE6
MERSDNMVLELLGAGALTHVLYSTDKSMKMDEKALKKYARAFERSEEAELMVRNKAEYTDKRLVNVAKKKRAIVENTVPKFVEVYSQIQKIDLGGENNNEIAFCDNIEKLAIFDALVISNKKEFTDKELVCGLLTKGLGKMMVMDSERYLSAANNQMREANVVYSQSESICTAYDAVIARADRIAKLLMGMNALFIRSIKETKCTIDKNGLDVHNYSECDKGVLMICVNIAVAMSDIINVPVLTSEGAIPEEAIETIMTGEKYLSKMNNAINTY